MTQTQQPATPLAGAARRAGVRTQREHQLEEVRQKMHQFVIHELGPLLTDQRVSEAELRRQVDEQLLRALSQERLALTVAERQAAGAVGHRRRARLRARSTSCSVTTRITEVMVNGPHRVYVERSGKLDADRREVRRRDAPPAHHRQDREPGRPSRRRGEPDGRRPPPRRLPCERRSCTRCRSAGRS